MHELGLATETPRRTGRLFAGWPTGRGWRWAVCLAVWVVCVPRMIPDVAVSDRGTFVTVAERLAAGDRLYVDVWDNKDPFFFYVNGLARWWSPWLDPVLEFGWVCLAGAGLAMVFRHLGVRHATPLAWSLTPIAVVGQFYIAGHTHLPGTAISLLVIGLLVTGRSRRAGLVLGVLLFTKVTIAPVALASVVAWLASRRDAKAFARGLGWTCVSVVGCAALLFARGELGGYAEALTSNIGYSDPSWLGSEQNPVLLHLSRVASWRAVLAVAVVFAALVGARVGVGRLENDRALHLWGAAVVALLTSVAVLAATAYWPHHLQALTLPAMLSLAVLARVLRSRSDVTTWLVLLLVAWLGAGAPSPRTFVDAVRGAPEAVQRSATPVPMTSGLTGQEPGSFARLGINALGEGTGLRSWTLSCRRFHQYPFEPAQAFQETLTCLPEADVVLVSAGFTTQAGEDEWNRFVLEAEGLLADDHACEAVEGGRVCRRE